MKFDKSKILTVVTADQAKVGQKGWFAILPKYIQQNMSGSQPSVLGSIDLDSSSPFTMRSGYAWPLFYPAPEPTYAERQAEWVKENGVKEGTKVRFTKNFTNGEDGSGCGEHKCVKGMEGIVKYTKDDYLNILIPYFPYFGGWAVPFTALEVIKEPTYTERQAEWVKENNVKEGTKVRVTRTFTKDEDGSWCWEHDDLVDMTGSVDEYGINTHNLGVTMSDGNSRVIPYFALEVIKEPTYEERQAEWVAKNNVKEGTKVRFTKGFEDSADGSRCCEHRDAKGMEGCIDTIEKTWLFVNVLGDVTSWLVPFTALEVIKEPTYRPYNNDELNDLVGEVLTNKKSGRRNLVTGKPTASDFVTLDGNYITAKDLLSNFYRNTNEPCGIKE